MATRRNILVVDDEPDVREQIEELLSGSYDLSLAQSFEEAVASFDKKVPDAAVLDIMGVNGEELLSRFRKRTPCVMLTAHALTPQHLKRSAEKGARLYLPKDELVRLPEYIEQLFANPNASLWRWLMGRLDFRKWFGTSWSDQDEKWLFDLTIEDIEKDLKRGWGSESE
jgi:CheY-like chemotaxis protein